MPWNNADPAEELILDLSPELKCKVISRVQIQSWRDANYSIVVMGNIQHNSQALDIERFAANFLKSGNLRNFYNELAGKFCLLVFDSHANEVHLVIDSMGIQTCYYTIQNDCLHLSESLDLIKSTPGVSCTLSEQSIFDYFFFHCIPAPSTIYRECSKLEPGKAATFGPNGGFSFTTFFQPEFATSCVDQRQLEKKCVEVIDEAVKKCVSQDCGAFLSGGLDSSTMAGMLARHQAEAKTFSIGFDAPEYDETPYALLTARHFRTNHEVLYLSADMAANEMAKVAQHFDEPFGNSSAMAAYLCAKFAKSHGVESLIAGDGGDELFAGNSYYAKQKQFEFYFRSPAWLKIILRGVFANNITGRLPLLRKAKSYIDQADIPLPARLGTYNFVRQFGVEKMFNTDFLSRVNSDKPALAQRTRYQECTSDDALDRMLYLGWKSVLADNDLVKVKKMCELAGVAVHFPLLEKSVVELSCQVPAAVKLPGFKLRDFYKKAFSGFLPEATLTKSKHGFGLPFGLWMKENQQLKTLAFDCLQSFRTRNIVSDTLIENALEAHNSVHSGYYGELIWIMVTLELWLQREAR